MLYSIINGKAIVYCSAEYFEQLPKKYKDLLLENGSFNRKCPETPEFIFTDIKLADDIVENIRRYEDNKNRAKRREYLMYSKSGGVYEPCDLDGLFNIQKGRCYFTGKALSKSESNYSIDHLTPVRMGGSSWPGNLALVLKDVNQEKHGRTKSDYWKVLENRHGGDWVAERKQHCGVIDRERQKIHKARRKAVKELIASIEHELTECFPKDEVFLIFESDILTLCVNDIDVSFSKGFLRDKRKFDFEYFKNAVIALI